MPKNNLIYSINLSHKDKLMFLNKAILNNDLYMAKTILEDGIDLNADKTHLPKSFHKDPRFLAIEMRNVEILKLLLDHNANINISNDSEQGLLSYALTTSNPTIDNTFNIIQVLLEHGIDPNGLDGKIDMWAPLYLAYSKGSLSCLDLILKYKADIHKSDIFSNLYTINDIKNRKLFNMPINPNHIENDFNFRLIDEIFIRHENIHTYYPHVLMLHCKNDKSLFKYFADRVDNKVDFFNGLVGYIQKQIDRSSNKDEIPLGYPFGAFTDLQTMQDMGREFYNQFVKLELCKEIVGKKTLKILKL